MNWQQPFVDVFKQFGVYEIAQAQGKGQIQILQDSQIGRKIIKLLGAISSNNTVTIPDITQGIKNLGLVGRYVYLQFLPIKGKYFVVHLDFLIKDRDPPIRFTVSNMWEQHKVTGNVLQIAYPKNTADKWTILILDVEFFLANFGLLPTSFYKSFSGIHQLKSFQLCSSMNVRGVYTSDNLYDWETMPKQMLFKLTKGKKYSEEYQIAFWPSEQFQPDVMRQALKEATFNIMSNVQISQTIQKKQDKTEKQGVGVQSVHGQKPQQLEELVKKRPGDQAMYTKAVDAADHPLQPNPICQLKKVIGFTVHNCPDLRFGRQSHTQNQIVYTAGNLIVLNDIQTNEQKFLFGHSQTVSCLDLARDGSWIVSGQSGTPSVIRIWDYNRSECLSAFATPYQELVNLSFSSDKRLLVSVGKDDHNRELIIVWGLDQIDSNRKPVLIAKQSASCNIISIKISPVDNTKVISCGHENIRFWRIKNAHLPAANVVLNHHCRNTTFLVFDFEYAYEDPTRLGTITRVFFGAKSGQLFQVGYTSQQLEAVYKVHDDAISALVISAGFCVSGSKDQFLRVWPLDFSEFYMEAKHEGVVTSLDVSLDGLHVCCGTSTGGLGILAIKDHNYRTINRSHTGRILQLDFCDKMLITLSDDCTIRLWDLDKQEQVYEFTYPLEDSCTCIKGNGMFFAAGFRSGIVRIFDIENTSILHELNYHDCEIANVSYSTQGMLLIVSDVKSVYRIYDANRNYEPIKTLPKYIQSKFNSASFSMDDAILATIGDSGTHINLWDVASYQILVKIFSANTQFKQLKWAYNNLELVAATGEGKIKIYGVQRTPETITAYFLREQSFIHKAPINDMALSPNLRYIFTVGNEPFMKVWDFEFTIKGPGSSQIFIGHSSAVNSIGYKNQTIITAGGDEGIFQWEFLGYSGKNERNVNFESQQQLSQYQFRSESQLQQEEDEEQEEQQLEDVQSQQIQSLAKQFSQFQQDEVPTKLNAFQTRRMEQNFKASFVDYSREQSRSLKECKVECESGSERRAEVVEPSNTLELEVVVKYDWWLGNNVVWNYKQGWLAYSSGNLLVVEKTQKERSQRVVKLPFVVSAVELCKEQKHVMVGGQQQDEYAPIWILDDNFKLDKQLLFHTRGVVKFQQSENKRFLISIGNAKECTVAVWDFLTGKLLASSYTLEPIHDVKISKYTFSKERLLEFTTVGKDQVHFWALTKDYKLEYFDVFLKRNARNELENITAVDYLYFSRKKGRQMDEDNSRETDKSVNIGSAQHSSELQAQLVERGKTQSDSIVDETFDLLQVVMLGLDSGELILMEYGGDFKVLLREQIGCGPIRHLFASQPVAKIVLVGSNSAFYVQDLKRIVTFTQFLDARFPFVKHNLPAPVQSIFLEPMYQQALLGLANHNVYMLNEAQVLPVVQTSQSTPDLVKLLDDNTLLTVHGAVFKLWNVPTGEILLHNAFDQQIVSVLYSQSVLYFFLHSYYIATMTLSNLNQYHLYRSDSAYPPSIVSATSGRYESLLLKLAVNDNNELAILEEIYKNQDYALRATKLLELTSVDTILLQQKLLFVVQKDTAVVQTYMLDFNPDRQYAFGFTLYDQVDFKEQLHGKLDDQDQLKETQHLYQFTQFQTKIAPCTVDGVYFAIIQDLQYVYARNYHKKSTIYQVPLQSFPLGISMHESTFLLYVSTHNALEIIDPNDYDDRSLVRTHLNGPIAFSLTTKKHLILVQNGGPLCVYKIN